MPRYYTVQEANAALPRLRPLIEQIMKGWERLIQQQDQVQAMIGTSWDDIGGPLISHVTVDLIRLQNAALAIQAMGIELKDASMGLVDFRTLREGEEAYLCWRYGESSILYWHPCDTGFAGRRPIEDF